MENNPKFVSEYPLPPPYYKLFQGKDNDPSAPPLPDDTIDLKPYNGIILTRNPDTYSSEKNYKALLKSAVKRVMEEFSLFISEGASPSGPQNAIIERRMANIHSCLDEFYKLLSEYRTHHATELLCIEMDAQLERAKEIENILTRGIEDGELALARAERSTGVLQENSKSVF